MFSKNSHGSGAAGTFLYLYLIYGSIWFVTALLISGSMHQVFGVNLALSTVVAMVGAFYVFKIQYVKAFPFRSLLTIGFLFLLVMITFS